MEDQIEILATFKDDHVIVLNKKAKYQLGIIAIKDNTYFVANDEKPYKHLKNAIDSLIEQAYIS